MIAFGSTTTVSILIVPPLGNALLRSDCKIDNSLMELMDIAVDNRLVIVQRYGNSN